MSTVYASASNLFVEEQDAARQVIASFAAVEEGKASASATATADDSLISVTNALRADLHCDFKAAVFHWKAADLKGYPFSAQDLRHYISSTMNASLYSEALPLLKRLFQNPKDICPKDHWTYVAVAVGVENWRLACSQALQFIQKAEDITPYQYLKMGHLFLKVDKKEEASKAFEEFFLKEDPRKIDEDTYFHLADFFYGVENVHMSDKCMNQYFDTITPKLGPARAYAVSAMYALEDDKVEKAIRYWGAYMSLMGEKGDQAEIMPIYYLHASLAYGRAGEYRLAIAYSEKYLAAELEPGYQNITFMNLGWYWSALGETQKACAAYDQLFTDEATKKEGLSKLSPHRYFAVATSYLSLGKTSQAERVLRVLSFHHPKYKTKLRHPLGWLFTGDAASSQQKKKRLQKKSSSTPTQFMQQQQAKRALLIQESLRTFQVEKCKELYEKIGKLSMADRPEMAESERGRVALMTRIKELLERVAAGTQPASSSHAVTSLSLPELQHQVVEIEDQLPVFIRLHNKAQERRVKDQTTAYYRSLSTLPDEVIPLEASINLRSLFPHEKSTLLKEGDSFERVTSSSHEERHEQPLRVSFRLLKEAKKDYDQMMSQPGMRGKYSNFIRALSENPLEMSKGAGKPKRLQGADDLYSRRFDKGNRMVYHVKKTGEDTFEVTLYSLLGHYKHLAVQQKASPKKSVLGPKRSTPKSSAASKKSRKTH